MEQHYQIVNLHNIIRTQQAKIHELREELRIANQREQKRYGQFSEHSRIQIDEKDKMIQFLKEELDKNQTGKNEELNTERNRHDKEKDKMQTDLITAKRKNIEYEGRIKRMENEHELQTKQLVERINRTNSEVKKLSQTKNLIAMQISQMNQFYKNSLFQISKRKETLLWVDKFTEYLDNCQSQERKTLEEINGFVIGEIEGLRTNLAHMVTDIAKNQQSILSQKSNISGELTSMLNKIRNDCENIYEENEQFWQSFIRSEKNTDANDEVKRLSLQISKLNERHHKELEQLRSETKRYESEKKTLILGFQQLRSLNEHRQAAYKKEIKTLKDTINDLIENGEQRDKQFEEEIKLLSNQIQHIGQRYYQNIEFPVRKFNEKISFELENVKNQLQVLQDNSILKNSIDKFEEIMGRYVQKIEDGAKTNEQVQSYLAHSNQIILNVMNMMKNLSEPRQQEIKDSKSISFSPDNRNRTPRNGKKKTEYPPEIEVMLLDLRQKANKNQYETILAKKHLAKMQEHCQQMQKRYGAVYKLSERQANKKMRDLQAENQALKEGLQLWKDSHQEDIRTLKQRIKFNQQERQSMTNYHDLLSSAITRIQQSNTMIQNFIVEEKQHFQQMHESMRIIQTILIRPMQSFQVLVKQFSEMSKQGADPLISGMRTSTDRYEQTTTFMGRSAISEEIKTYKQLLGKKSQNTSNVQRLLSQLIRTLKQTQKESGPTHKNKLLSSVEGDQNTPIKSKNENGQKSKPALEKKIRQIQSQRIKDRQELLTKVDKLNQQMEKINSKIQKSATLKNTLSRFQVNLNGKIDEIVKKMQLKLDKHQLTNLKEDVIKDLRSKLADANFESEGLRKEMSLLLSAKE